MGRALWLAGLLLLGGCTFSDETDDDANADLQQQGQQAVPAPPAPPPEPTMELEVVLADRELRVYRDGQLSATHPVAVGSSEWPTPTGEWTIGQVIFNPRWVPPPNEEWSEDEEIAEPGDPDNPLGRAQLVYSPPNSIHGTKDTASLGKAVSHGSIRVSNDVAIELARQVMEAGGAQQGEAFIQEALSNPKERKEVAIPNPVPIRVVENAAPASGAGARDTATARQ